MATGDFKLLKLQKKLEVYEESLDYLTKWCKNNEELSLKISNWISSNTDNFELKHLKIITQYHIDISKVHYATIALLDKVYKNKERLDKWKEDIQNVQ